jgi:branched-chain amino acid aminotransferase
VGILEGITRNAVIALAQQLQIPFAEKVFTQTSVYNCDECFLTGTGAEVVPVVQADDRRIGDGRPGPMTKQLIDAFRNLVRTEGVEIKPGEPAYR